MFDPKILHTLATKHSATLRDLHEIEQVLNRRFFGMEQPITALLLAVASGEPLLLVGKPGTAKSRLIRTFCGMVDLLDLDDLGQRKETYFEYLLTPFTEPGELFGYYDVGRAARGEGLFRLDSEMMQKATVVYLDEVFNASSAILNTLLAFINEKYFHDRDRRVRVPLECLFAATNQVPDTPELRAIYDRFVLRCHVDNIESSAEEIAGLLDTAWRETFSRQQSRFTAKKELLGQLKTLRKVIQELTQSGHLTPQPDHLFYNQLAQLVTHARTSGLSEVSNRRLVKMVHVMLIHRLYQAVANDELRATANEGLTLGPDQLVLFRRFFLDREVEFLSDKLEEIPVEQLI